MTGLREVFPKVFLLSLPLPFELEFVNVYLVKLSQGWMLIDCGMDTDAAFAVLSEALQAEGIRWTDIRQIFLTHMHPDHMGLSAKLLELSGAELLMHEHEARHLRLVTGSEQRLPWMEFVFTQAGVPKQLQERIDQHFSGIRKNFHDLIPNRTFSGGEEIETAIGRLIVHWTPGHSPGHVCLYCPEHRLLFSGDQILEDITPNIAWHPEQDTLADYLASLENLKDLEIDLILPSHGQPFSGHRVWIEETIEHHRQRCGQITALLREGSRTAHSLVGDLWRRELAPIHHHFAVFEVMAHLKYMQGQGSVISREQDGAIQWQTLKANVTALPAQ